MMECAFWAMIVLNPTTRDRCSQTELKRDCCATSKGNELVKRFELENGTRDLPNLQRTSMSKPRTHDCGKTKQRVSEAYFEPTPWRIPKRRLATSLLRHAYRISKRH
jgi:hypothetical protein